ncbi:AAA family ATPase [Streptomyces sp. NPDC090022]|uniref:AAA family ATPase n=1 Tax=Streptomyces sp. NPDC090022 TaxID=3365920 RepID=UPI00382E2045
MQVIIQPHGEPVQAGPEALVLESDNWNDWGYYTSFTLWYRSRSSVQDLGFVKVAVRDQARGPSPLRPGEYNYEPGYLFSLGQSDVYYDNIRKLGFSTREDIFKTLGDIARDDDRFRVVLDFDVTQKSLLRDVAEQTVRVQFRRIAYGGVRRSEYRFSYLGPGDDPADALRFDVDPETHPSSNVHVLVGPNGVGKTHLLRRLAQALVRPDPEQHGRVMMEPTSASPVGEQFVNVVSVTFSAFDPFTDVTPLARPGADLAPGGVGYAYVGLRNAPLPGQGDKAQPGVPTHAIQRDRLKEDFTNAFERMRRHEGLVRWVNAIRTLSRDPQFAQCAIAVYASRPEAPFESRLGRKVLDQLIGDFAQLSSGHAIVVLAMTELVGRVVEQSLVLVDEPETHLHPPLLASFVQALSNLMTELNGVAILATHSPVVLQSVPRSCVYKLIREGEVHRAERPEIETYGENVGVLTHEVFGLEVMRSGFYEEVARAAAFFDTYAEVMDHFGGQLGGEARGIVRIRLAEKTDGLR